MRALKDGKGGCGNIDLEYLSSLRKVYMYINCEGASFVEVVEVEAALRKALKVHPNRPTLQVYREHEIYQLSRIKRCND